MTENSQHTNGKAKQKITPNLWLDTQAEEAAAFYVSLFEHSRIGDIGQYDKRRPRRRANRRAAR